MKLKKIKQLKAFTLVELIIVITILAILATIAFISFQGYTKDSRDSNRLATIKSIENGLDIYQVQVGNIPLPDEILGTGTINNEPLTFVGRVGDNITRQIKINTIPKDPLSSDKYIYGVSYDKNNYQVATVMENLQANNYIINTTYADNGYKAKVNGNYKGLLKYNGYLYNLPSLIFTGNLTSTGIDLLNGNTYFVVNNGENLPYKLNKETITTNKTTTEILKSITNFTGATLTGISLSGVTADSIGTTFTGDILKNFGGNIQVVENIVLGKVVSGNTGSQNNTTPAVCNYGEDGSSGVCKDPYWNNVVLAMHMNGINNSTGFIDEKGNTIINNGNVEISNLQSKFNETSGYFNGSTSLQLPNVITLLDPIFTIEGWVYITANGGNFFEMSGQGKFNIYRHSSNQLIATLADQNFNFRYLYIPFSLNTWHHFAFVRKSLTDITLYIDGIGYSETIPTNQFGSTTSFLMNPNGYMDEFRITKGIARYTTGFTVPIQAFPNQ